MGYVPPGQRPPSDGEIVYNYVMLIAFFAGVVGYFVFAAARSVVDLQGGVPPQTGSRASAAVLGILAFIVKVALLGGCWYAFLVAFER
jgi:hypothetical protein